jgi:hypothetical protein
MAEVERQGNGNHADQHGQDEADGAPLPDKEGTIH